MVPFAPLQESSKVLFVVNALMTCEPEVAILPDQPPEAVQVSTLLLVQLSVVEPFYDTTDGLADRLTMGASGSATVTLAEAFAVPPGPLQVKLKLLFVINPLIV